MNDVFFACRTCKSMVDAGYRWAFWSLDEAGICNPNSQIDVPRVLGANAYWSPQGDDAVPWLTEALLAARTFLEEHKSHEIVYCEDEFLFEAASREEMAWLEVGPHAGPTLRSLVERHDVRSWHDLDALSKTNKELLPWWWGHAAEEDVRFALGELLSRQPR